MAAVLAWNGSDDDDEDCDSGESRQPIITDKNFEVQKNKLKTMLDPILSHLSKSLFQNIESFMGNIHVKVEWLYLHKSKGFELCFTLGKAHLLLSVCVDDIDNASELVISTGEIKSDNTSLYHSICTLWIEESYTFKIEKDNFLDGTIKSLLEREGFNDSMSLVEKRVLMVASLSVFSECEIQANASAEPNKIRVQIRFPGNVSFDYIVMYIYITPEENNSTPNKKIFKLEFLYSGLTLPGGITDHGEKYTCESIKDFVSSIWERRKKINVFKKPPKIESLLKIDMILDLILI
jgi:hypothetical protein